ncbi:hypothetical protein [Nocardia sp. NPDC059239]|uniref:hypothetical protein n=1 Tax=unclassified Nocardia TaxID=2637762 RepID=UPI0036A182C7
MSVPWTVSHLDADTYRFENSSGTKAVMITLQPIGTTTVAVVPSNGMDAHAVATPVDEGASFDCRVKGTGVRITWTAPALRSHATWDFRP